MAIKKSQISNLKSQKTTNKPTKTKAEAVKKAAAQVVEKVAEKTTEQKAEKPKPAAPTLTAKSELVKNYQEHQQDTGSTAVQVAIITERINELVKHLKKHAKDFDSKRGLLILVGKRRRLLNYLRKTRQDQYDHMIKDLGLRK